MTAASSTSTDSGLRPRRPRRRWSRPLIAGLVTLVLAATVGITAGVVIGAQEPPVEPKAEASFDSAQLPIPRNALMLGTPVGWALAPGTTVAAVAPEVGHAVDGAVALRIEAPTLESPSVAASADIAVIPGATYTFSASVRTLSPPLDTVPAWFTIAGVRVDLPPLSVKWAPVSAQIEIPDDATGAKVALELGGALAQLSMDRLSLIAADTEENLIPNPSFEEVASAGWLLNESLVLETDTAALAVVVPPGEVTWRATDVAGTEVARGTHTIASPIDAIPLDGIPQGFFTIEVAHADGAPRVTTVAVIDSGTPTMDPRFGVTTHLANAYSIQAPRLAASLGFGIVRDDVLWRRNEATAGVYAFDPVYDIGFGGLRANGIELLAIIDYGNTNYGGVPSTPEATEAYARYAAEVVARYSPAAVEVWNEFNIIYFNKGKCGLTPACYLPLLTAVDQQLSERGFDDVTVVAGATALYDGAWFDGLWDLGGLPAADVMSYHPYETYDDPRLLLDTVSHAQASTAARGKPLPIWITELGWTTKTGGVSDRVQAERLVQSEVLALSSGVERYFWYDLINDRPDPAAHEGNFGLFAQVAEGVAANQPKLAALSQALLIDHIGSRSFSRLDEFGDAVTSAVFGQPGDEVRVAWTTGDPMTVDIPSDEPLTVTSVDGVVAVVEPSGGVVSVPLAGSPVFVSQ